LRWGVRREVSPFRESKVGMRLCRTGLGFTNGSRTTCRQGVHLASTATCRTEPSASRTQATDAGITQRLLTKQLRALEDDGLVIRKVYAELPPRVEYRPSEIGDSLRPVIDILKAWGESHSNGCPVRPRISPRNRTRPSDVLQWQQEPAPCCAKSECKFNPPSDRSGER
jgi:DNA-binding HxlR family transcriptional regulator